MVLLATTVFYRFMKISLPIQDNVFTFNKTSKQSKDSNPMNGSSGSINPNSNSIYQKCYGKIKLEKPNKNFELYLLYTTFCRVSIFNTSSEKNAEKLSFLDAGSHHENILPVPRQLSSRTVAFS